MSRLAGESKGLFQLWELLNPRECPVLVSYSQVRRLTDWLKRLELWTFNSCVNPNPKSARIY